MAGLNDAAMAVAAAAIKAAATHAQLHSAAAGAAGTANVCTGARKVIAWGSTTGAGDFGFASVLNFTGGAAAGPVYSVTLWSQLAVGGTIYGEFVLVGDTAFTALGEYTVTTLNLDGSAS